MPGNFPIYGRDNRVILPWKDWIMLNNFTISELVEKWDANEILLAHCNNFFVVVVAKLSHFFYDF